MKEIKLLGLHNTVAPEDKNIGLFFLSIHLGIKGVTNNFRSYHKGEQSCSLHTQLSTLCFSCLYFVLCSANRYEERHGCLLSSK